MAGYMSANTYRLSKGERQYCMLFVLNIRQQVFLVGSMVVLWMSMILGMNTFLLDLQPTLNATSSRKSSTFTQRSFSLNVSNFVKFWVPRQSCWTNERVAPADVYVEGMSARSRRQLKGTIAHCQHPTESSRLRGSGSPSK
jgi:hypothetical protein